MTNRFDKIKVLCAMVAMEMLILPIMVMADILPEYDVVNGIRWAYTIQGGGAYIGNVHYWKGSLAISSSTTGAITIPASLGGYPVVGIWNDSFKGCSGLTSVTIPSSVMSIGQSAFNKCSGLVSVSIASSVTSIETYAFRDCSGLKSVMIPSSVRDIGMYAFENCSGLTSVVISDGVTSIGGSAFAGCSNLESVKIPGSIEAISAKAFSECSNLKNLVLSQGIKSIGKDAFVSCFALKELCIPDSVLELVGDGKYVVSLGGYRYAGAGPFAGCTNLEKVVIGRGCKTIGPHSFYSCIRLSEVVLGDAVTKIGKYAFGGCTSAKLFSFKGLPPEECSESSFSTTEAIGTYTAAHRAEWKSVIDSNGYWNGLKMEEMKGPCYSINYNPNGGEGNIEKQECEFGGAGVQVDDGSNLHWEGHCFLGWAFAPDGEVVYKKGDYVKEPTEGETVTLYAVWVQPKLELLPLDADWKVGSITLRCEDEDTSGSEHEYSLCYYDKDDSKWYGIDGAQLKQAVETPDENGVTHKYVTLTDARFSTRMHGIGTVTYQVVDENGRTAECITRYRHGLFVAVNEYQDEWQNLNDHLNHFVLASDFGRAYERYGGTSGYVKTLHGNETKRDTIFTQLNYISQDIATPGDVFLFYYVGHGANGVVTCWGRNELIYASEFANTFKNSFQQGIGIVAVFDSCHSDGMIDRQYDWDEDGNVGWIVAARTDQVAYCGQLKSVLCDKGWLNGCADVVGSNVEADGNGFVSFAELALWGQDWMGDKRNYGRDNPYPYGQLLSFYNSLVLGNVVAGKVPKHSFSVDDNGVLTSITLAETTDVAVPENVTRIAAQAFESCQAMTGLTLPNTLMAIDSGAFAECVNLKSITFNGGLPEGMEMSGVLNYAESVRYPRQYASQYEEIVPAELFAGYTDGDAVEIETAQVPSAMEMEEYEAQLECSGGTEPYWWSMDEADYLAVAEESTFAEVGEAQGWREDDGEWVYDLPFAFNFGGRVYDSVVVSDNACLYFVAGSNTDAIETSLGDLYSESAGQDIFVERTADHVTFRWKRVLYSDRESDVNCSITLNADGTIRCSFGDSSYYSRQVWLSTARDGAEAEQSGDDDIVFVPNYLPLGLWLDEETGVIYGAPEQAGHYEFDVYVSDGEGAISSKRVTLDVEANPNDHSSGYRIVFDARDGAGAMSVQIVQSACVYKLPKCTLKPPEGKTRFAGWAGSNGRRYDDEMLVFNLAQPGETVTMTAIWDGEGGQQKELGGVQLWEGGPYWAECNVGATKPEECGYYFWWGDTVGYKRNANNNGWISVKDSTKFSFVGGNCSTNDKGDSQLLSEGYIDASGNLGAVHDAATAHLGSPWRMPTDAEFSALINNCTTTWTTRNGVFGRLVTGKGVYSSKRIFLPAAGYGDDSSLTYLGSDGYYWSSTSYSDYSLYAWFLDFSSGYFCRLYNCRFLGQSVRPVRGFAK